MMMSSTRRFTVAATNATHTPSRRTNNNIIGQAPTDSDINASFAWLTRRQSNEIPSQRLIST